MRPALASLLVLALTVAPSAAQMPTYQKRLHLPFVRDDLGFSRVVASDLSTGEIFVGDWRGNRVAIFDRRGRFRHLIPGGMIFSSAQDLAVHPDGYIYVLAGTGDIIHILDFDGSRLGRLLPKLPASEEILGPRYVSLALSPDGEVIFLLDQSNYRLWISTPSGQITGSIDYGQGRSPEERQDLLLSHVDVYDDTVLVSIMTDGRVYLYDLQGKPRGYVGRKGTTACLTALPVAAALDARGRILVLDNQRALGTIWQPEGNECLGEFSGFGNAPGRLYRPSDMTLDGEGRVYIGQGYQGRVQVFTHDSPAAGAAPPAVPGRRRPAGAPAQAGQEGDSKPDRP